MDLWTVAAATGAAYVAKYWKNLSGEKVCSVESSSPTLSNHILHKVSDTSPDSVFRFPKLARRWFLDGDGSSDGENSKSGNDLHDDTKLPVSGLPPIPIFIKKQVSQDHMDEINPKNEVFDELRTKKTDSKFFSSFRLILAARSRGIRPENDIKTHVDLMEDCKLMPREKDPFLDPVGSAKLPGKPKDGYENKQPATRKSGDGMVLLLLGITIGAMSAAFADQREVDDLNRLLEHAEGLVRELQNELEMKDRFALSSIPELDECIEYEDENRDNHRAHNFEYIEAELAAELELLEKNMKRSTAQSVSYAAEVDSDYEAHIARGDLELGGFTRRLEDLPDLDQNDKTGRICNPKIIPDQAISPLDLRLRLHEEIESRLRARIKELELVLQNIQNKPSPMGTQKRLQAQYKPSADPLSRYSVSLSVPKV